MKKTLSIAVLLVIAVLLITGCTSEVPPGTIGRVSTPDGWQDEILKPGRHTCYGRDDMYLVDITNKAFSEKMKILVGGKVNLTVDFMVRVHANAENTEMMKKAFETITADEKHQITNDQMYNTFLRMKALAIPRMVFEVQPDVQTAVANSPALANEIRKEITEIAKSTPMVVDDAEITNYDWPESINGCSRSTGFHPA
jgi:hypothetical protein